jgi:predicted ATPase/class 3 adenylate cyclase
MEPAQPVPFGELLTRYRRAADLTQEALAERAGLSVHGISALERGVNRTPQRETVRRVAQALGLAGPERAMLEAAARPPARVGTSTAAGMPDLGAVAAGADPGAELPSGTLTFLLTDIEGSTTLWEQHPAAMQGAIARHDTLMDEVLARYGGRQVKERGEGDSIFAVFTSPAQALAAVCALQQALLAEPWPAQTPLRVRLGLHTGEADLRGIGYYGVTVNRTARIRSLAHGGQILLSQATRDLVQDTLPAGVSLRSLGPHLLKGLARAEEVHQVLHPALPADFPPLLSPQAPRHNLPLVATSFIGREEEQATVRRLLTESRLLTLTGAGGCGKTRLALEVAATLVEAYPDGVWLAELAALADPTLVQQAVATALGLREDPGRALLATLTDYLEAGHRLLVLDNCEHLVAACAELAAALLRDCPGLRILATSRERLAVAGETTFPVPSLAVPDLAHLPPAEQLRLYASVRLFVERARAQRPQFTLTAKNAPPVCQICAHLDGIPLAIELAAARVTALSPATIAARLDDRFRLLTGGPRTALPRQQTLRAALDWSHELLSEAEQVLFARLAVFVGGWTLEAAEAVCARGAVAADMVLDLLSGLIDKSLVVLEDLEGEARYRLLETVRQYGLERLEALGEAAALRDRHLAWCAALAEAAEPALRGPEQASWLARLEAEHDNLRAALGCSTQAGRPETGLRLATALGRFWRLHSHLSEGLRWLDATLDAAAAAPPALRARALLRMGTLALAFEHTAQATPLLEESLSLFRQLGDQQSVAAALGELGHLALARCDYSLAAARYRESLVMRRAARDVAGMAISLHNLAWLAFTMNDPTQARTLFEESLALAREVDDTYSVANALSSLADVVIAQSDYAYAGALFTQSLALYRELGDRLYAADSLVGLGDVAHQQGEYARARTLYEEGVALYRMEEPTAGLAYALRKVGQLGLDQGEYERAQAPLEEALALSKQLWSQRSNEHTGLAHCNLGRLAHGRGDHARADSQLTQGVALLRAVGNGEDLAYALSAWGRVAFDRGEYVNARARYAESLALAVSIGAQRMFAECLEGLAMLAATTGQPDRGARFYGAADVARQAIGTPVTPGDHPTYDRMVDSVRTVLGEKAFAAAWAAGRAQPLEAVIAEALKEDATPTV